jgi:hypothetical protein
MEQQSANLEQRLLTHEQAAHALGHAPAIPAACAADASSGGARPASP